MDDEDREQEAEEESEEEELEREEVVEEEEIPEPKELEGYDSQTESPESPRELSVKMDEEHEEHKEEPKPREHQESLVKILRRRSTRIRWKDEDSSSSESDEDEMPYVRGSRPSVGSGMSLTLAESTIKSMIALPDEKIDMLTATSLLHQQASEIRSKNVNWVSYLQSQVISEEDFNFIAEFDSDLGGGDEEEGDGSHARENLLRENSHQAAMTFFNLLEHISKDHTIQYILVMIDDMLQEDRRRVEIFREYCAENNESVWKPFINLLHRSDGFIKNMSSRIITKIACWSKDLMEKPDLRFYLAWLRDQLRDIDNVHMQSVARCLQMILRVDEYRFPFVSMDGITVLLEVLQTRLNYQIQYQLVFCLWVLTFNPLLVEKMHKFNLVPTLVYVLSNSAKDKVTRIILSLFRNLIEIPEDIEVAKEHCVAMVQCKVLKQLTLLSQRKFDDEDILSDIAYLNEKLLGSVQELSSFDVYTNQVKSGHLDWSPVHKSAKFWRENAVRLNEENHELLRMLINLLETSQDSLILSVACFDVGEYVRYYPKGKHVIDELGGKELVMQLLGHDDPNVRYEALLAVQKLMIHSWEYLAQHLEEHQMKTSKSAISTSSVSIK